MPKPTPPAARVRADQPHAEPPGVKLTNAACPRCEGDLWYSKKLWLQCRTCVVRVAPVPTPRPAKGA